MSCLPKSLKIYSKYSEKIHKGFCSAAGCNPEDVGSIGCVTRSFVDRYYSDLELLPWGLTTTASINYYPKERKLFFMVTIDDAVPKSAEIINYTNKYTSKRDYYLQPVVQDKDNDTQQVKLIYSKENIYMKNLENTVYEVMSQFFSDEIDDYLDPFLTVIKEYKEATNE